MPRWSQIYFIRHIQPLLRSKCVRPIAGILALLFLAPMVAIQPSISRWWQNGASHRKNFDTPPLRGSCECTTVHFHRFQQHDNFRCT
jgi:hypothetical protein